MSIDELRGRSSIAFRPISGTATPTFFPSVLPPEKSALEVFWVRCLLSKMEELAENKVRVIPNDDDSHGKHDVIVEFRHGTTVGIQVTEMTYEFQRKRASMRETYTKRLLVALRAQDVSCPNKVVVSLSYNNATEENLKLSAPEVVAEQCRQELAQGTHERIIRTTFGSMHIHPVVEGEIFVPSFDNIGIAVNIDLLPRSIDTYVDAINNLAGKKSKSISPWLLIWSVSFWQDKHWLGDDLIEHARETFAESNFEQVFFLESRDGDGIFQTNLTLHRIKTL